MMHVISRNKCDFEIEIAKICLETVQCGQDHKSRVVRLVKSQIYTAFEHKSKFLEAGWTNLKTTNKKLKIILQDNDIFIQYLNN